jgi:hypothetical protein
MGQDGDVLKQAGEEWDVRIFFDSGYQDSHPSKSNLYFYMALSKKKLYYLFVLLSSFLEASLESLGNQVN